MFVVYNNFENYMIFKILLMSFVNLFIHIIAKNELIVMRDAKIKYA